MKRRTEGVITITVRGVEVVCTYDLHKGFRGSLEEPPSDPYCEVWKTVIGGVDLDMDHLNEKFIAAIQEAVESEVWTEDCVEEDQED